MANKKTDDKDIEPQPEFRERVSFFDFMEKNCTLNSCPLRGFVYFALWSLFLVDCVYLYNMWQGKQNLVLWNKIIQHIWLCLFCWLAISVWTWNAFIIQKLIIAGLPRFLGNIAQFLVQKCVLAAIYFWVYEQDLGPTQSMFISMSAMVHFFKMHSYNSQNEYFQQIKDPRYPANVNLKDFLLYLVSPVLVYQPEYPRNKNFRFGYLVIKVTQTFMCFMTSYIIVDNAYLDYVRDYKSQNFLGLALVLSLPMGCFWMACFTFLFEGYLNSFAELSCFADRMFYEDWWNSTGLAEFNRRWNRVVYLWLKHHIYNKIIYRYKLSTNWAQFLTFSFSALFHEVIIFLVIRRARPYLTSFMMLQIPLIIMMNPYKKTMFPNMFLHSSLTFWAAFLITLYSIEFQCKISAIHYILGLE